jgi:hypothetical protein
VSRGRRRAGSQVPSPGANRGPPHDHHQNHARPCPPAQVTQGRRHPRRRAGQRTGRKAAAAKLAATTHTTPPPKAGRRLHLLTKKNPCGAGTALAKMFGLVRDGMTTIELAAAMRTAGLVKQRVSGFVSNAVARKALAVDN